MHEKEVFIGNVYRAGEALLQVTQPRVPCFKLGIRMGDSTFVKTFMQRQRTGWYLRVLEEGIIGAGDTITLEKSDPHQMTVRDINNLLYFQPDKDLARKALQIESLSPGWADSFEAMIAK